MDAMTAIRQTFFQECEEQLVELESGLLAMNEGTTDSETVNAVFRAVHSIKGGAGAFKLDALVQFAHTFETALDHVRSGKMHPCADTMKIMLRAADVVSDLVEASRENRVIDEATYAAIAQDVRDLTSSGHGEPEEEEVIDFQPAQIEFAPVDTTGPATRKFTIAFRPKAELYRNANEPELILRELNRLGNASVNCDLSHLPLLDDLDTATSYFSWDIALETEKERKDVEDVFEFVVDDSDLKIEAEADDNAVPAVDIAELLSKIREDADRPSEGLAGSITSGAPVEQPTLRSANLAAPGTDPLPGHDNGSGDSRAATSVPAATSQATIRVEFDRVDRLINLVGELVINQAMLSQRVAEANITGAAAIIMGLDELELLTREIQESVMAIRAQPVKPLFQRMSRIVRDVADATGKQVRLKTEGEATEVDKTVVERLAEPLTHMIRNAVDHGIETPERRTQNGKSPEGVVRLTAAHRSGRILIEIEDDGAGINRQKVRESAISKELISPDAQLTDGEIDNLLFLPGFSTASTVSNISGRGVGMDVVKRSIQALGGRIGISSRPGKGSTFSLSLPLTLAVLDGMVVSISGQTFVVPLTAIVETLKPRASEVHGIGAEGQVMAIRNTFVPLVDVGSELGFRSTRMNPENGVAILVEAEGGARSALLVDGIQDQRQVVIKSLEANYRSIPGVAAATILGDGRVALILDVDGIVGIARGESVVADLRLAAGG